MKIYLSLPIAGHEDTVYEREKNAIDKLNKLGFNDIVSPLQYNQIDEAAMVDHISRTAYYMGRDIEAVINCDAIYMTNGWENSKGCNVEHYTAQVYNKNIIYE